MSKTFIQYINAHFNEERALYHVEAQQVVMSGDDKHSHIEQLIEGFFEGVYCCGVKYEYDEVEIDNTHELYQIIFG